MARFTAITLEGKVNELNSRYPLKSVNGFGNLDRFGVMAAYDGYRVIRYLEDSTGHYDTHGGREKTPRAAWLAFCEWVVENPRCLTN